MYHQQLFVLHYAVSGRLQANRCCHKWLVKVLADGGNFRSGLASRIQMMYGTPCLPNRLLLEQFSLCYVAERALFLWNNAHTRNFIRQNCIIILAFENGRNHWNQVV
ncbi:hypothetical protein PanWU01x14_122320 [Parasponia andersonii]|uniref:Uncharacterized protein n=1 Tax=Parasponia andersonii TaxID=3476 RepID=A0A2P5CUL9_PARAD|nr:hypothetical protein PanWU01x14_122320 [Parasponia andersonii]